MELFTAIMSLGLIAYLFMQLRRIGSWIGDFIYAPI